MFFFFTSSRFVLKANLMKFAVVWVKGRQKEGVFGPDKLQNHTNEGKRKEKEMREEDEKQRREKSKPCTLSFYDGYFRDYCWTEKVQLAVTFSKIRLDI